MRSIPMDLTLGPFTVASAEELGVSRDVLNGTRFRRPWVGVRVLASRPDTLTERCRAAALVLCPSAVFSHSTAVDLAGWLTPALPGAVRQRYIHEPDPAVPIHVSVPRPAPRPHARGMIGHSFDPLAGDLVTHDGLRITSPWRTWCDLGASGAELLHLVILAEALRRRWNGAGSRLLEERLYAWDGGRGAVALRRALQLSRDDVDSPMESRLRMLFADAGLPEPVVNAWIRLEDGTPVHKADLAWPQWRVAADYDGRHHAERDDDADVRGGRASNWRQRQDASRRDVVEEAHWGFRVFTAFDVFRRPERSVMRMQTRCALVALRCEASMRV
ncbi:MAG: hypothetical protein ACOH16_05620 [Propionibacteriaceae bacterium]